MGGLPGSGGGARSGTPPGNRGGQGKESRHLLLRLPSRPGYPKVSFRTWRSPKSFVRAEAASRTLLPGPDHVIRSPPLQLPGLRAEHHPATHPSGCEGGELVAGCLHRRSPLVSGALRHPGGGNELSPLRRGRPCILPSLRSAGGTNRSQSVPPRGDSVRCGGSGSHRPGDEDSSSHPG